MAESVLSLDMLDSIIHQLRERQQSAALDFAQDIATETDLNADHVARRLTAHLPDVEDIAARVAAENAIASLVHDNLVDPLAEAAVVALLDHSFGQVSDDASVPSALLESFRESLASADLSDALADSMMAQMAQFGIDSFDEHLNELVVRDPFWKLLTATTNSLTRGERMPELLARRIQALDGELDWSDLLLEKAQTIVSDVEILNDFAQNARTLLTQANLLALIERQHLKDIPLYEWFIIRFEQRLCEAAWRHTPDAKARDKLIYGEAESRQHAPESASPITARGDIE